MELSKGFQSKRVQKWVRTDGRTEIGRTEIGRTEIGQTHIDFFESPTQYALRAIITIWKLCISDTWHRKNQPQTIISAEIFIWVLTLSRKNMFFSQKIYFYKFILEHIFQGQPMFLKFVNSIVASTKRYLFYLISLPRDDICYAVWRAGWRRVALVTVLSLKRCLARV